MPKQQWGDELSSDQIDAWAHRHIGRFYRGWFPKDRLPHTPQIGGYIVNMQNANDGDGTHWVGLCITPKACYYFDSFGFPPPKAIQRFVPQDRTLFWSRKQVQDPDSTSCGYFALDFLRAVSRGATIQKLRQRFSLSFRELRRNDATVHRLTGPIPRRG